MSGGHPNISSMLSMYQNNTGHTQTNRRQLWSQKVTLNISCMLTLYQSNTGPSQITGGRIPSGGHPKYHFGAQHVLEWHRSFTAYWWASTKSGGTPKILVVCRVCIRTTQDIHTLLVGNKSQGDTPNISSMLCVYQNDSGHSQPTSGHLQSWGTPQISVLCWVCIRTTAVIHSLLVGIYIVGGHPKYQFYAECVSEWQRSFTAY